MSTAAFYSGDDDGDLEHEPLHVEELDERWIMFYVERTIAQAERALAKECEEEN